MGITFVAGSLAYAPVARKSVAQREEKDRAEEPIREVLQRDIIAQRNKRASDIAHAAHLTSPVVFPDFKQLVDDYRLLGGTREHLFVWEFPAHPKLAHLRCSQSHHHLDHYWTLAGIVLHEAPSAYALYFCSRIPSDPQESRRNKFGTWTNGGIEYEWWSGYGGCSYLLGEIPLADIALERHGWTTIPSDHDSPPPPFAMPVQHL